MQTARARKNRFYISDDCIGCTTCAKKCPFGAIVGEKKKKHVIDPTLCRGCGTCWYSCPKRVVEDPEGYRRAKEDKARVPKAKIEQKSCAGCQNCLLNCDQGAVEYEKRFLAGNCTVDQDKCKGCGQCLLSCPSGCISLD